MSQTMEPGSKECPYCRERVHPEAVKCRYCSEYLDDYARSQLSAMQFRYLSRGIATSLSAVVTGLGQLFQGRLPAGMAFMIIQFVLLIFLMVSFFSPDNGIKINLVILAVMGIVHIINIFEAHTYESDIEQDNNLEA